MELIADLLLVAGALGAGLYCFILSRRLNKFNSLEKGVGGAVAVLSSQVDDLEKTLVSARQEAGQSANKLTELTERAAGIERNLELKIASLHDLATTEETPKTPKILQESNAEPMFVRHSKAGESQ